MVSLAMILYRNHHNFGSKATTVIGTRKQIARIKAYLERCYYTQIERYENDFSSDKDLIEVKKELELLN